MNRSALLLLAFLAAPLAAQQSNPAVVATWSANCMRTVPPQQYAHVTPGVPRQFRFSVTYQDSAGHDVTPPMRWEVKWPQYGTIAQTGVYTGKRVTNWRGQPVAVNQIVQGTAIVGYDGRMQIIDCVKQQAAP